MRKIIHILIVLLVVSGCDKFLDVNPRSKFTDADMFSSAEGVEDALYGVYAFMGGTNEVYARTLTIYFPEISSGNFYVTSVGNEGFLAMGDWLYPQAYNLVKTTWENAYKAIGFANNIINHFEDGDVPQTRYHDIYFGEALALRALMHFDLMRVYGPAAWSTDASAKNKVIPYVKRYSYEITPFGTWDEVYDNIIADLIKAEGLLKADEELMTAKRDNIANGFTSCRMTHMNLYAAQALLARVYWTKGDLDNAAIYARKVIESGKFPLMDVADFINFEKGALNMKETILGFYSRKYIENCNGYFKNEGTRLEIADYISLYAQQGPEPGVDYRRIYWFDQNMCVKMMNPNYEGTSTDSKVYSGGKSIIGSNIIRIPEMYYIMAEYYLENNNVDKAIEYIDYVIESRGMVGYADRVPKALTMDDIYNEFRKEFYGEGQQWFNMKRLKKNIRLKSTTIAGGDAIYRVMVPPTVETDLRE